MGFLVFLFLFVTLKVSSWIKIGSSSYHIIKCLQNTVRSLKILLSIIIHQFAPNYPSQTFSRLPGRRLLVLYYVYFRPSNFWKLHNKILKCKLSQLKFPNQLQIVIYHLYFLRLRHRTAPLVFWPLKPAVSSDRSIPAWQGHKI